MKLAVVPVALAAVLGAYRWRHLPRALRYVAALAFLGLLTEIVSRLLWLRHQSNLFLLPAYTAGEFALLLLLFRETLRLVWFRRAVPWLIGAFGLYALLVSVQTADLVQFNAGQRVVESVVVLGCVGLYLRQLLHEPSEEPLTHEPLFWVCAGLLIYFVGDVLIFLFSNYLLQRYSRELNLTVWAVHAGLMMLLYGGYCLALWLPRKK